MAQKGRIRGIQNYYAICKPTTVIRRVRVKTRT